MAIDTGMWGLSQFEFAIKNEVTVGTALKTAMQLVNIDNPPTISKNTERFLGIRSGDGRTAKSADVYVSQNGKEKEISFTALYDETLAPIFIATCMGVAVSTSPASYDIAYNYTSAEIEHADDVTGLEFGTLTAALISPEGSNTVYLPGCVTKSFRMYADAGTDGGRFKMDVTLASRYNFESEQVAPTTPTVYPVTYRTLYDIVALNQIAAVDVVLNKIELTLNSNAKFYGFGLLGIPDTIGRGLPEFECTCLLGVKYDANTAATVHTSYLQGSDLIIECSDNATWASATFGFKGSYARIADDFELGEVENGVFVDIPFKFMAHTSGDVLQLVP